MALSPAEIHRTLSAADHLSQRGHVTQAFILAWTAWDAYNYRFVLAAIQMQGLTQSTGKDLLTDLHSHQFKNMNRIRNRLLVDKPASSKSVQHVWQQIENDRHKRTYRQRRNGLVHGSDTADPRILQRGVGIIREALEPPEILETLRARVRFGDVAGEQHVVGRILVPRRPKIGSRAGTGNPTAISEWLR
jgi:hypothetical protein